MQRLRCAPCVCAHAAACARPPHAFNSIRCCRQADIIQRLLDYDVAEQAAAEGAAAQTAAAGAAAGGPQTAAVAAPEASAARDEALDDDKGGVVDDDLHALSDEEQAELRALSADGSPDFSAYLDSTLKDFDPAAPGGALADSLGDSDEEMWDDLDQLFGMNKDPRAEDAYADSIAGLWDAESEGEGGGGEGGAAGGGAAADEPVHDPAAWEDEVIEREVHVGWAPSAEVAERARARRVRKGGVSMAGAAESAESAAEGAAESAESEKAVLESVSAAPSGWYEGRVFSFASLDEARRVAAEQKLSSPADWKKWVLLNAPATLPENPDEQYADFGWTSWEDFLDENYRPEGESAADGADGAGAQYRSFEDARQFAQSLGLRSRRAWMAWVEGNAADLPVDIPRDPEAIYGYNPLADDNAYDENDKAWMGWSDFLGTWEHMFYSAAVEEHFEEEGIDEYADVFADEGEDADFGNDGDVDAFAADAGSGYLGEGSLNGGEANDWEADDSFGGVGGGSLSLAEDGSEEVFP